MQRGLLGTLLYCSRPVWPAWMRPAITSWWSWLWSVICRRLVAGSGGGADDHRKIVSTIQRRINAVSWTCRRQPTDCQSARPGYARVYDRPRRRPVDDTWPSSRYTTIACSSSVNQSRRFRPHLEHYLRLLKRKFETCTNPYSWL